MAEKRTLFGIVGIDVEREVGLWLWKKEVERMLDYPFRLHISKDVTEGHLCVEREERKRNPFEIDVWLDATFPNMEVKFSDRPTPNMVYERELHLGVVEYHSKPTLTLKEGSRFMTIEFPDSAMRGLMVFLMADSGTRL